MPVSFDRVCMRQGQAWWPEVDVPCSKNTRLFADAQEESFWFSSAHLRIYRQRIGYSVFEYSPSCLKLADSPSRLGLAGIIALPLPIRQRTLEDILSPLHNFQPKNSCTGRHVPQVETPVAVTKGPGIAKTAVASSAPAGTMPAATEGAKPPRVAQQGQGQKMEQFIQPEEVKKTLCLMERFFWCTVVAAVPVYCR